jgi:hypothetical protein
MYYDLCLENGVMVTYELAIGMLLFLFGEFSYFL